MDLPWRRSHSVRPTSKFEAQMVEPFIVKDSVGYMAMNSFVESNARRERAMEATFPVIWQLYRPSFWPEPRDPWAWQRALRILAGVTPVADPWPCWEQVLRGRISRRAVPGLYGRKASPAPPLVLGTGLLAWTDDGWVLEPAATSLLDLERNAFVERLGELLVRRSPWVRLALMGLASGSWRMPRGAVPLHAGRQLRVDEDLWISDGALSRLPPVPRVMGELYSPELEVLKVAVPITSLSGLHAPLHLLHSLGWIDGQGRPTLPPEVGSTLAAETPAVLLRRISREEEDGAGFVPFARVAHRLWSELDGSIPSNNVDAWADQVFGSAIERGQIEIQAWAPGQPRHGRGLRGDRNQKRVRWTVHEDFDVLTRANSAGQEEFQ